MFLGYYFLPHQPDESIWLASLDSSSSSMRTELKPYQLMLTLGIQKTIEAAANSIAVVWSLLFQSLPGLSRFSSRLSYWALLLSGVIFFQAGCASIVQGTHQDIPISSDPSGAAVLIDGVREGSTPANLRLSRKKSHVVTLELEGYETENTTLTRSIGGAVVGNIIAGGVIGWGVDAANGSQYNLSPASVNVRLRAKPPLASSTPARRSSAVDELLDELEKLENMKREGTLSDEEYSKLRSATLDKFK